MWQWIGVISTAIFLGYIIVAEDWAVSSIVKVWIAFLIWLVIILFSGYKTFKELA